MVKRRWALPPVYRPVAPLVYRYYDLAHLDVGGGPFDEVGPLVAYLLQGEGGVAQQQGFGDVDGDGLVLRGQRGKVIAPEVGRSL